MDFVLKKKTMTYTKVKDQKSNQHDKGQLSPILRMDTLEVSPQVLKQFLGAFSV